jgi:hypothetical protein
MPTTRIQPVARLPLATASTRKESPTDNWVQLAPSFLPPGTLTKNVSFLRKESPLCMWAGIANIAAVETTRREGVNDEEVFRRALAGEPELYEIAMGQ